MSTLDQQAKPNKSSPPIGIFDSGVGGLSVMREIRWQLPAQDVIYFADQAHVPYGSRPLEQVRDYSKTITGFLLDQGAGLIVVACNTASAAALKMLRTQYAQIKFVGMEPAIKPAAEQTQTGTVGILATPATFQGAMYASVVERFANGVQILQDTCPGLVAQIESGDLAGPKTRRILENALLPMLAKGVDTIVLGCTHYPFVIPLIQQIAGTGVRVIDPAPAVARQTGRMLAETGLLSASESGGRSVYFTSGNPDRFDQFASAVLQDEIHSSHLKWRNNRLFQ